MQQCACKRLPSQLYNSPNSALREQIRTSDLFSSVISDNDLLPNLRHNSYLGKVGSLHPHQTTLQLGVGFIKTQFIATVCFVNERGWCNVSFTLQSKFHRAPLCFSRTCRQGGRWMGQNSEMPGVKIAHYSLTPGLFAFSVRRLLCPVLLIISRASLSLPDIREDLTARPKWKKWFQAEEFSK